MLLRIKTAAPDNYIRKYGPHGFDRCQFKVSDERFHRTDWPIPLNQCPRIAWNISLHILVVLLGNNTQHSMTAPVDV